MRHSSLWLFVTGSVLSSAVVAANERFVGPAVAIGGSLGVLENKVDLSPEASDLARAFGGTTYKSTTGTESSALPLLDASWQWSIAPTWVAGAGINLEIGKRRAARNTLVSGLMTGDQTATLQMKQQAGIYALAGKQLGANWLLYGKVGYHRAKGDAALYQQHWGERNDKVREQSVSLRGASLGIGATREWQNGLQLRMETEYIAYKSYTQRNPVGTPLYSAKPSMTRVNVMLGYRF